MRRTAVRAAIVCALAACSEGPSTAAPTQLNAPAPASLALGESVPIPGRYIVRYRANTLDWRSRAQSLSSLPGAVVQRYFGSIFNGAVVQIADSLAPSLLNDPNVLSVEQDQMLSISSTQYNATWGLDRVDQRNRPLDQKYSYTSTGAGITVYIVDTGIDFSQVDFGGRASTGIDFVVSGGPASDCNGHGTHVAGTVGSATYGIAKQTTLKAVRVLDCTGHGPLTNALAAIDWITMNAPRPAVVNMSFIGPLSASMNAAVEASIASGITYAIAAGNNLADACSASPSSAPSAIVVGATDSGDAFASWSNFGSCVRILAPGVNIASLGLGNGSVSVLSGTSMAAPHVAGAAALYLQVNPTATPLQVRAALTGSATSGAVSGVPASTPNLLLYTGFLTAQPAPVASFTSACTLLACTFDASASTALASATYSWTFGDGASSTGKTTQHLYATGGSYTVTLTVADVNGSTSKTSTFSLVGNQPPTAIISLPTPGIYTRDASGVVPISFAGTANDPETGLLPGGSLVWTSNRDGQIGTGTAFSKNNLSVGAHTVTLIATDAQGAADTATTSFTVAPPPPPVASFTSSCVFLACTFDASSSTAVAGATYSWTFGDASTGTGTTPAHLFATGGSFTVTLTITDATGTTSRSVVVSPVANQAPVAAIALPLAGTYTRDLSAMVAVSFAGTGIDPETGPLAGAALVWRSSRDGQIGTGTAFTKSNLSVGTHAISLISTDPNGASDTATTTITIAPTPPPVASFTSTCTFLSCTFDAGASTSAPGATYSWAFGDGATGTGSAAAHVYTPGSYTVTLTVTDAFGTAAKTGTVIAAANRSPTASISLPLAGIYTRDNSGGVAVVFTGAATDPESGILSGASLVWRSNIDGQIGTGLSFTKTDLSLGAHTITLTATDPHGASHAVTTTITVAAFIKPPPVPVIAAPGANASFAAGAPITFTGSASDVDGALPPSGLTWSSSRDGQIGVGLSFTSSTLSVGQHVITLRAKVVKGKSGEAWVTITINAPANQPPTASITSPVANSTAIAGASVSFAGVGNDPETGALAGASLVWTSNRDGQIGTGVSFARNNLSLGAHTITLAATDAQGATTVATTTITMVPPPNQPPTAVIASPANNSTFVRGASVSLAGSGIDPEVGALTGAALVWTSSRDGQIGTGASASTTTLSVGTHVITLLVTDPQGASASATATITVVPPPNQPPTALIALPSANATSIVGASLAFAGSGNDPESGAMAGAALVWTSSRDGQVGTGTSFSTSALTLGTHTITLTATDAQGATGSATTTITIVPPPNQPPTATILAPSSNTNVVQGIGVSFSGSGNDPETGPMSGAALVWTSNRDGQIGTGTSFVRTGLSLGVHAITLTVTDPHGLTGTATTSITVVVPPNQPPIAAISAPSANSTAILGASVSFVGSGNDPETGAMSGAALVWTSNRDGQIGTGASFSKTTLSLGAHTITLTATDAQGASAIATTTITILAPPNQPPTASIISPAGGSFVLGTPVAFSGSGNDPESGTLVGASLVWTSDRDGQLGTGASFSRSNLSLGAHVITLTAADAQGATASATRSITIVAPPNQPPTATITSPSGSASVVQGSAVSFAGTGSDPETGALAGAALVWSSSRDGQIGTGTSFTTTTLTVGAHTITLTATDPQGASVQVTRSITVTAPVPPGFVAAFTVVCGGSSALPLRACVFDASATNGTIKNWAWNMGNGVVQQKKAPIFTYVYPASGTYQVTLTATDMAGQNASVTKTVVVP